MRDKHIPSWARLAVATALLWVPMAAFSQTSKPIKIALIASKTGPAEQFGRETERGVRIALDQLTGGTMTVLGRKIELIVKDDQFKPDMSKALLTEAFADDGADLAIGTSWSGGALAMAPVAEEYRKILVVDPAVADSLTGSAWNRYLFRANRNSFQDALASAAALKDGDSIAFLAPDYVFGKDGVAAFKEAIKALKIKVDVAHEEFVPQSTTDFTAPMQRILGRFKGASGKKYIVVIWGAGNPTRKISELVPAGERIDFVAVGGPNHEHARMWSGLPLIGGMAYFYTFPKNPMNDAFVAESLKRYKVPPDGFTASGFISVAAILSGLRKAGSTDSEKLIAAMEGMDFDTPKGRLTFRKEDHQAIQPMYVFRMKGASGNSEWDLLDPVREVPAGELPVPLQVKKR
ncbi:branched-chain amino acid transport system substrate-binding protein [Variovorax paradoxus]|nr:MULTISPECIES: substrate-binding domain-containing protein [Variovorax]MDR6522113.1 branched-chain amino acid transport system substrate-binding protein [Variovorax paradoxus]